MLCVPSEVLQVWGGRREPVALAELHWQAVHLECKDMHATKKSMGEAKCNSL